MLRWRSDGEVFLSRSSRPRKPLNELPHFHTSQQDQVQVRAALFSPMRDLILIKQLPINTIIMHTTTAILSLLAFTTGISAVPIGQRPVARAVPDINMVIRNPMPIDGKGAIDAILHGNLPEAIEIITNRAAPALTADNPLGNPVDVVGRASPPVRKPIKNPVDVIQ